MQTNLRENLRRAAPGISSNAASGLPLDLDIWTWAFTKGGSRDQQQCGFRLAPGPGHGHLRRAAPGISSNAASGLPLDLDMGIYEGPRDQQQCGFRLAPGPGHGHLRNAAPGISRNPPLAPGPGHGHLRRAAPGVKSNAPPLAGDTKLAAELEKARTTAREALQSCSDSGTDITGADDMVEASRRAGGISVKLANLISRSSAIGL
jgi:hypothetical protein